MSDDASSPRIDPEVAGRREFTKARKGFDTLEVKAHILEMAGEISRLASVEVELRRELAAARRAVEDHDSLDPAVVTRILGEETARVLETARAAAQDIEAKAEASAEQLIADAQEKAARLTSDAADLRSSAQREAEERLESARAEAEELVSSATRDATEARESAETAAAEIRSRAETILVERTSEADAEAERIRTAAHELRDEADTHVAQLKEEAELAAAAVASDAAAAAAELVERATADAEATAAAAEEKSVAVAEAAETAAEEVVEEARERGRQMVTEARDARERMLRDLAERRAEARRQLEALRAGRERLLESFAATRAAFDTAGDELDGALGAARVAADEAAHELDEDLDRAVFELDDEIAGGTGPLSEIDSGDESDLLDGSADESETSATGDGGIDGDDEDSGGGATVIDLESVERGAHDDDIDELDDLDDDEDDGNDLDLDALDDDDDEYDEDLDEIDTEQSPRPSGSHLRLVGDESAVAAEDADGDTGDTAEAAEDAAADDAEEIFARLRAGEVAETADTAGSGEAVDESGAVVEAAGSAVAVDVRSEEAEDDDESMLEEEPVSEQQALLDRRDAQLGDLHRVVGRRCKRTIADLENGVLDRIRRSKKAPSVATALDAADDEIEFFAAAVRDELANAAEAGVSFVGEFDADSVVPDVDGVVAAVLDEIDERIAAPLRSRLVKVIESADGDSGELAETVRSTYRQFRSEQLDSAAGDLVTSAFNRGVLAALGDGTACTWAIDHQGLPCADAEDNQLAGPVETGVEFPTGVASPPAHPGCRCLLVPATR